MAESSTLARPYARAAFEYARDQRALESWSQMLLTADAVVREPTVLKLLASPQQNAEEKGRALVEVCGEKVDEKFGNFLKYLARNDRLALLPDVRHQFELLKAQQEKTVDVDVSTAFEMTEAQKTKLLDSLKGKLQREVNLQTTVDSELIGGALVRAGDLVIDASVRGRLAKLAETMNI